MTVHREFVYSVYFHTSGKGFRACLEYLTQPKILYNLMLNKKTLYYFIVIVSIEKSIE